MALTDYQFEYVTAIDTLTFGENGATVPNVDVDSVRGLLEMEARVGDREFARQSGDIPGLHRATPRIPTFKLEVRGPDPTAVAYTDLVVQTRDIFTIRPEASDTDGVLNFKFPGEVEQFIRCRPIRRKMPRDARTEYGLMPIEVQLRAADPRIYDDALTVPSAQSGTFNVTNLGNSDAYPILNFGAVASVKLTNNTIGSTHFTEILSATGSGSLIANMDRWIRGTNQLLVFRGSTDNYPNWTQPRIPFRLLPGINSLTLNTGTNVVVSHRDTWL